MDKEEVRLQWMAALLGGEYKQAQHALKSPEDKMCCLGVGCDLHAKLTGKGRWLDSSYKVAGGWSKTGYPPLPVEEWLGITHSQALVLAFANDDDRKKFKAIARMIGDMEILP